MLGTDRAGHGAATRYPPAARARSTLSAHHPGRVGSMRSAPGRAFGEGDAPLRRCEGGAHHARARTGCGPAVRTRGSDMGACGRSERNGRGRRWATRASRWRRRPACAIKPVNGRSTLARARLRALEASPLRLTPAPAPFFVLSGRSLLAPAARARPAGGGGAGRAAAASDATGAGAGGAARPHPRCVCAPLCWHPCMPTCLK